MHGPAIQRGLNAKSACGGSNRERGRNGDPIVRSSVGGTRLQSIMEDEDDG